MKRKKVDDESLDLDNNKSVVDDPALDRSKMKNPVIGKCIMRTLDFKMRTWDPVACCKITIVSYQLTRKEAFGAVYITAYDVLVLTTRNTVYRISLGVRDYALDKSYLIPRAGDAFWLKLDTDQQYNIVKGCVERGLVPASLLNPQYSPRNRGDDV